MTGTKCLRSQGHLWQSLLYPFGVTTIRWVSSPSTGFPTQSLTQVEKIMAAAEEQKRPVMYYDGPSDYSSTLACISSGYANLPRERPRHAPARRRGSRFGRSAPGSATKDHHSSSRGQ
jgi:hypothetical protein